MGTTSEIDDGRLYDKYEAAELCGYTSHWGITRARQQGRVGAVKRGKEFKYPGWALRRHNQGLTPNGTPESDRTGAA